MPIADWLPPLAAGVTFTGLGLAKVYGLFYGIQGGGCKPARDRACGTCPSWSRTANLAFIVLLLVVGLGNLAILCEAVTGRSVGSLPGEDVGGQVAERPVQDRWASRRRRSKAAARSGSEVGPGGTPMDGLRPGQPRARRPDPAAGGSHRQDQPVEARAHQGVVGFGLVGGLGEPKSAIQRAQHRCSGKRGTEGIESAARVGAGSPPGGRHGPDARASSRRAGRGWRL